MPDLGVMKLPGGVTLDMKAVIYMVFNFTTSVGIVFANKVSK
jgi:hypothetical protein